MVWIFNCTKQKNRDRNPSTSVLCKKPNRETRSWRAFDSPSTIPHAVFLPRTRLPFTWYSLSLPTTAKGIASCEQRHLNMVQCTEESYARFMRWNKCTTCPSALAFCLEDSLHVCERGWVKAEYHSNAKEENRSTNIAWDKKATYSDFIVVTLVFHVIIKLFLWVKFNPAHLQLLPYLECRQKQGKMNKKKNISHNGTQHCTKDQKSFLINSFSFSLLGNSQDRFLPAPCVFLLAYNQENDFIHC